MDDWDLPFVIHGDVMNGLKQIEVIILNEK